MSDTEEHLDSEDRAETHERELEKLEDRYDDEADELQQRSDELRPCGNSRLSIHAGIKAGVGLRIVDLFRPATAERGACKPRVRWNP